MNKPSKYTSIKNWSELDRPREKLINKGISTLSDSELIAILIGSGNKNKSAVELAREILDYYKNDLSLLGKVHYDELTHFTGMGPAKAISVVAALELGRRRNLQNAKEKTEITSSVAAFKYLQPLMGDLQVEEFRVLYLNRAGKVIENICMSKGGTVETVVDVKIILKHALKILAQSMIIAHNHPSGSLTPSKNDKLITQKIFEAAKFFDIQLLDHIIVADKSYFSFKDENLL